MDLIGILDTFSVSPSSVSIRQRRALYSVCPPIENLELLMAQSLPPHQTVKDMVTKLKITTLRTAPAFLATNNLKLV